jgi:hypothetical protein
MLKLQNETSDLGIEDLQDSVSDAIGFGANPFRGSTLPNTTALEREAQTLSEFVRQRQPINSPASSLTNPHSADAATADASQGLQLVKLPAHSPRYHILPSFHALQEWEGYVTAICDEVFVAELVDVTRNRARAEEQVDFLLSDLDDEQRKSLRLGAVFRWAIGYERSPAGSKKRVSQLIFRELPQWTQADLDAARAYGQSLTSNIQWE